MFSYAECTVGDSVQYRGYVYKDEVVAVRVSEVIPCDGEVIDWMFWVGMSGRFRAMVVRPNAGDPNRFTIVGINDLTVTSGLTKQETTYRVPVSERFMVKYGDMIAVGMLKTDNPGLHGSNNTLQEIKTRWTFLDPATLTTDAVMTTQYTGDEELSIAANIRAPGNCFAFK